MGSATEPRSELGTARFSEVRRAPWREARSWPEGAVSLMLCRRCGMDSSTTDTCEWCNRPMLPAGAAVSGKAAKDLKKSGQPIVVPSRPAVEAEVGLPLHQQPGVEPEAGTEADPVASQAGADLVLRPLGHGAAAEATLAPAPAQAAPRSGGPSHGLGEEVTQTSVDISEYVGKDQSIFRPIEKEVGFSSASSLDRVTTRKSSGAQTGPGSNWSENDRLMRSAIAGVVIASVFALGQFFIAKDVPSRLFTVIPLGSSSSFLTAIKLGIVLGLAFGFMLGALLVRLQKGPGIGMLLGIVLGYSAVGSLSIFALAGALAGIFVGRFATLGVRKVINV